jgi:glycosyltransferase involved in cell wall biosynthesis
MTKVTIVVPVFNEEDALPIFLKKADELFIDNEEYAYDMLFINDGSKDGTLQILQTEAAKRKNLSYISFSRNFGQDPALEAGLKNAVGDVVIPMDVDLQDPPELIKEMLKKAKEGFDIVNPQRIKREGDSALKRKSSGAFYKFINKISGREVMPENVSQFKLLSRKAVDTINSMPEKIRLLRSEVPFVGFKTCYIPFERKERSAGKTKYHFKKIFNLAFHTITSSTLEPLNWPLVFGVGFGGISGLGWLTCLVLYIVGSLSSPFSGLGAHMMDIDTWLIISTILVGVSIISLLLFIPCVYLKDIMANTQGRPTYIVQERFDSQVTKKENVAE